MWRINPPCHICALFHSSSNVFLWYPQQVIDWRVLPIASSVIYAQNVSFCKGFDPSCCLIHDFGHFCLGESGCWTCFLIDRDDVTLLDGALSSSTAQSRIFHQPAKVFRYDSEVHVHVGPLLHPWKKSFPESLGAQDRMIRVMYSFKLEARVAETNDMKDATPSNWNFSKGIDPSLFKWIESTKQSSRHAGYLTWWYLKRSLHEHFKICMSPTFLSCYNWIRTLQRWYCCPPY